ncbi:hypothetical protein KCTCHS21_01460 [Cohnella abietis]|uniref:Uncharacterized protein n=1 Tax=Cohnella abietis TaxID=2507935 RepID=A0A3T1CY04_9BACL|nr:hypothetical protein KCTCHS21_01460 [Cohnella abietis]
MLIIVVLTLTLGIVVCLAVRSWKIIFDGVSDYVDDLKKYKIHKEPYNPTKLRLQNQKKKRSC